MKNSVFLLLILLFTSCGKQEKAFETKTATSDGYTYEYVTGDPMNTRIYTLNNGLKVYLSDYENAPRVQALIAVDAGSKNDPSDNTGLAHYLEHMLFKGNNVFGTLDYDKEKVYLDSIELLFNQYAQISDPEERKKHYQIIDAVSSEAATYAVPNELDKMFSLIGGKGINAYTAPDQTVYMTDIPSNEIGRFLEIEGSRFKMLVPRLFHTELEAVYEEKNRSLDNDSRKVFQALMEGLFPNHPYGTQTGIGTIEHLKNPSITAIKEYFDKYYRPNNVAICLSGDIEYTETIKLVDTYFGDWEPNNNLEEWQPNELDPISTPVTKEVYGPDAESVYLSFRFDGRATEDYLMVSLVDMLLNNSEAGLIDINLKQKQMVLNAGCSPYFPEDYGLHYFYGNPKQSQSLDEVKDLILGQIDLVKQGAFEDWLIEAVITDFKKSKMKGLESNSSRASNMVEAFYNDISWSDYIQEIEKMEAITKEQLVAYANEKYKDNYVVVYKYTGEDPDKQQVEKPLITKVPLNRDAQSEFYVKLASTEVPKIQPVFLDYEKDMAKYEVNGLEVLSKVNEENELFELVYYIEAGNNADPRFGLAGSYLDYVGTDQLTAEEFKQELYKLGCSFNISADAENMEIKITGLDEKMEEAIKLVETQLSNPDTDQESLDKLVDRIFKSRIDQKKDKGTILFSGLWNYAKYGPENSFSDVISNNDLKNMKAEDLVDLIRGFTQLPHKILYYGPRNPKEIASFINDHHSVPDSFKPLPENFDYEELETENKVFWTNYDMVQEELLFLNKNTDYDPQLIPEITAFNEYFGGGMNSIVFQEIREAQGLAYAVSSKISTASKKEDPNYFYAYIGTQADKQSEAMDAMMELLNNLPESEKAFEIAKGAILNKIESERTTKMGIIRNYLQAQKSGIDYDIRKDIYSDVSVMEMEDLSSFHEKYLKGQTFSTVLIGARDKINFEDLKKYGEVKEVSLDELFGYEDPEKINVQ